MNKIILLFFLITILTAQSKVDIIGHIRYSELPDKIRIENSGIYAIESFAVSDQTINLITQEREEIFTIGTDGSLKLSVVAPKKIRTSMSAESYQSDGQTLTDHRDGSYSDQSGRRLQLRTIGRSALLINSNISGKDQEITLAFQGDLAYAELIGIDSSGNLFLLIERYRSEIPLNIQREVLTIDAKGNKLSVLEIPSIKYMTTDKDFRIDARGTLYHMMTTAERVIFFKWIGLNIEHSDPVIYPSEYSYSLHYNDFVTINELPGEMPHQPTAIASRTLALRIGESYAMHQYVCTPANLSSVNVTAPDGDIVRTPSWLFPGTNARIPYKWGGFSSLSQFDAGLQAGKFAGDINTSGVSSSAVGVDCSGFVSRCWQMTYHSSTSMMPSITTQYSSWDSLKPGDAIHKVGHVRLFVERSANGGFRVVESAGRNWDVSYWTFAPSDLEGVYTPRFYNSMEGNYSFQRPLLTSALTIGSDSTALTWKCDTTGLFGYRIYSSVDGAQWSLFKNEGVVGNSCRFVFLKSTGTEFYRITSVKNDATKTESDWSNAMGCTRTSGAKHYLIVDGLERLTASWQSISHSFALRYGIALKKRDVSFCTMKNFTVVNDSVPLLNYDGIFWFLGDEGTAQETFSSQEQHMLKTYLQNGGTLFVSGSEVGYDLSQNGNAADKEFYSQYLKARYASDNASANSVKSETGGFYSGTPFTIGQVYVEDSPDEIDTANGSTVSLRFSNNKVAGVQYTGTFGNSQIPGKVIYLSFAVETAGNDTALQLIIKDALEYFKGTPSAVFSENGLIPDNVFLYQNYPNPFNPATVIMYQISSFSDVTLQIYDALGREVETLVNDRQSAGVYTVTFDGSKYSSGMYFARLTSQGKTQLRKLSLIK